MSEYKRLTKKDKFGYYVPFTETARTRNNNQKTRGTIVDCLAELETEIENGTLVRLPCIRKIVFQGATDKVIMYELDWIGEHNMLYTKMYRDDQLPLAEAKLRELKGE